MAQSNSSAENLLKKEQKEFMQVLREISTDSVIVNPIARSFDLEFNSLFTSIVKNKSLNSEEKDKAVKSMVFFMKELSL